jgi:hypothetical protein
VAGSQKTFNVTPQGSTVISFDTSFRGYYPGLWSWVVQGTTTHHQSVFYFRLLERSEAGINIINIKGAGLGNKASLTAKTAPNIGCNLDYFPPEENRSNAAGLGKKTTDANGNVSWIWTIGPNTIPGIGYVAVTCNDVTVSGSINVG